VNKLKNSESIRTRKCSSSAQYKWAVTSAGQIYITNIPYRMTPVTVRLLHNAGQLQVSVVLIS